MEPLEEMRRKLESLEAEIAETEARLPAHSIKPPIMQALLALEDERDTLLGKISLLTSKQSV
jgi:hypothetical protein